MQGQLAKATQEWASLFTNVPWQKIWLRAPKWATIILVVLVAKSAAELTWLIFAPGEQAQTNRGRSQVPQTSAQTQPRLRTVSDLHLFGVAAKQAPVTAAPIEAKETGLKLTLKGVFAADDPSHAMAIIADARGEEKVYRKNETIFSGVTLYQVYPDRVILERSGSFETLSLPRDKEETAGPGPRQVNQSRYTPPSSVNYPVRTRSIHGGKQLNELREQLTANPQEFWKNVRIEPEYDNNNQIKGYKFQHNDRQMMRALGLRPGDVIVEVNGQPLTDPSTLSGLLGQLSTASSVSLGIERNGRRETLNINM